MKKSLIALAAMAVAGVASAQSSVTLFGIVDTGVGHGSGSVSNKTSVITAGINTSRLGFRGTEDLGGGMSASFHLEAGLNTDNGSAQNTNTNNQSTGSTGGGGLTFNRRATVSLAGKSWGELRLGRDYSPQFWNLTIFDPFGTNGVGTTQTLNSIVTTSTAVRASNTVGYFLPGNLGGFYGQVQMYLGENNSGAATSDDGKGYGIRVGYAAGPLNVALAYGRTEYAAGDEKQSNIGGEYNFGVAKLMAHYSRDAKGTLDGKGWLLGTTVPVGAGEIRAAFSQYHTDAAGEPKTRKFALGYVHNLSKRTALYATFARVKNSGGAAQALNGAVTAANASSTGYDLGIRHSF